MCTNNAIRPDIITGFRPYRSAIIPQITEVKALPNINEDPSGSEICHTTSNMNHEIYQSTMDNMLCSPT